MSSFTKIALGAVSAFLITLLTACSGGDGPDSDYCKDLEASRPELQAMRADGAERLFDAFAVARKLADEAPGDVKDDWAVIVKINAEIEKALKEAGIDTAEELADLQAGKQPEDLDLEKMQGLPAKVQKLDAADAVKARNEIERHAKDVCKVTFES